MLQESREWLPKATMAKLLECDPLTVEDLAAAGKIAVRRLPVPRSKPRYSRADGERLLRESVITPEMSEVK